MSIKSKIVLPKRKFKYKNLIFFTVSLLCIALLAFFLNKKPQRETNTQTKIVTPELKPETPEVRGLKDSRRELHDQLRTVSHEERQKLLEEIRQKSRQIQESKTN